MASSWASMRMRANALMRRRPGRAPRPHGARGARRASGGAGSVMIVEAAFIYPMAFFVVVLTMYVGDVFYQRARIESYVLDAALMGSYEAASSSLPNIGVNNETGEGILALSQIKNEPYRFIFGGTKVDTAATKAKLDEAIEGAGTGVFGLGPANMSTAVDYTTRLGYGEMAVSASYGLKIPVPSMLSDTGSFTFSSDANATATAFTMGEMVRNVDMIDDYWGDSALSAPLTSIEQLASAPKRFMDFISALAPGAK